MARTEGQGVTGAAIGCVCLMAVLLWAAVSCDLAAEESPIAGLSYTNIRVAAQPWSIHVVRMDRSRADLDVRSVHAAGQAVGLSTLSSQVRHRDAGAAPVVPVAGINGDFYQRDRFHAGDPRGLQISGGELISAPNGGVAFWVTPAGGLATSNVVARFEVVWPDGRRTPFGLNADRPFDGLQLYTPAVGRSTGTPRGREWILERLPETPAFPVAIGASYPMRVREVRETGDSAVLPDTLVLSAGPGLAKTLPKVEAGATLKLVTASFPDLRGVRHAIGGGPVLVRAGKRLRVAPASFDSYEESSMVERHPRSAVGWNRTHLFLVEVDGRQRGLSVGMTLDELATWMVRLGCEEAMNLDGGGSATLWYGGTVRNSPCDRRERAIANSLVLVRTATPAPGNPGPSGGGVTAPAAPQTPAPGRP